MATEPRMKGRPRRKEPMKVLKLRASTFALWNERKESMGFAGITQSEFAEILLHQRRQHGAKYGNPPLGNPMADSDNDTDGMYVAILIYIIIMWFMITISRVKVKNYYLLPEIFKLFI